MPNITQRRIEKAIDILEDTRKQLVENGRFNTSQFEQKLKVTWKNNYYKDIENIVCYMTKKYARYKEVGIYYLQHHGTMGLPSEFKSTIAKAYGVGSYCSDTFFSGQKKLLGKNHKNLSEENQS